MKLVEDGGLNIDAPYSDYVPGFKIRSRYTDAMEMTPRHLLTHHTGLPDVVGQVSTDPENGALILPDFSLDYVSLPPGTAFAYSNIGYRLLGGLIESATDKTFSTYILQNIFEPLGMSNSSFTHNESLSMGYDGEITIAPPPMYDPAGSVCSSATDLAKFVKFIFAGGLSLDVDRDAKNQRVLQETTINKMLSVQNEDMPLDIDKRIGLGWHLYDLQGFLPVNTRAAGHSGYDTIFTSFLIILPDQKLGAVVLSNSRTNGSSVMNIGFRAIKLMHEARTGILTEALLQPKEDVSSQIKLTATELERYIGFYETNGEDPLIEITLRGGHLESTIEGKRVRIVPLENGRFTLRLVLFGFLPIRLEELERSTFSFQEIEDFEVILEHRGPFSRIAGTKLDPVPIPAAWRDRLGTWECLDPGDGLIALRTITLWEHKGFLVANVETLARIHESSLFGGAVLEPLNENEAIVPGIQHSRNAGETLQALMKQGEELLRYNGCYFRPRIQKHEKQP